MTNLLSYCFVYNLFFYYIFLNMTTLYIHIKFIVAQAGVEPATQGYEPYMLPLHHRAIL